MCLASSTIPGLTRDQIERAYHGTSFVPEKRAAHTHHGAQKPWQEHLQERRQLTLF